MEEKYVRGKGKRNGYRRDGKEKGREGNVGNAEERKVRDERVRD